MKRTTYSIWNQPIINFQPYFDYVSSSSSEDEEEPEPVPEPAPEPEPELVVEPIPDVKQGAVYQPTAIYLVIIWLTT